MPHELEYIVDQAVCHCDKGAAPNFFTGLANKNVKINGCMACTKADKIPKKNIPSFGVCSVTGGACTPLPIDWTDTYKVRIKGEETLLFKSKLPCSVGGKIEFMTSGQVPVSQEDLDKMTGEHSEQEKEEDGLSWWDAVEMVPFIGGVVGIVRSGMKDPTDWLGVGLSVASLALDVGGLFSFGAGNAASAGVKAGKLARAGAKVIKAANKVKKAAKLTKLGAKALGKSLAKHVDDIAMATGKVCVFACFPAGTKVHAASGQRNIEDIVVGDEVWAWDEESGAIALKAVTATMQREVDATVEITLEGETIETTAEHPFYTRDGWKDAADLTQDDELQTKEGDWAFIKKHNFAYQKRKVFNFEVEGWHTYFVGVLAWLAHNAQVCLSSLLKHATTYGLKSYKELKALAKGTGLQVHHLIEKRFANIFKPPKIQKDMLSVVLTKEEHQIFTNAWRKAFPYGKPKPTPRQVEDAAKEIYKDYPEILKGLGL
ncbi:DUF4280 domain-containing protein [Pedobacter petrophilus]|uniref:DUF4280 domain-containing protein n=1 Tax=Pedobacter petrophilus TaxID=1908241 RepID=A0A7K0G569_9SPHI|nr:polymorphic toxin-type HINT domain-containing protein [Pedobacter petrophilus]MRX78782.1 DUF4280 domain-containing protein [Pedobacter petrophilus]